MHTRPITRADLPAITNISFHAWMHDSLNEYVWPKRLEHLDAYHSHLAQRNRNSFVKPSILGIAVIADSSDTTIPSRHKTDIPPPQEGQIMGFAWFERIPDGKDFDSTHMPRSATLSATDAEKAAKRDLNRNRDLLTTLERGLCTLETRFTNATGVIGIAQSAEHTAEVRPILEDMGPLVRLPSHWHVTLLGTDPRFEGRGVGSMLVQYGKDLARESGTPLSLTSASGRAQGLYTKKEGMRVVGWMTPFKDADTVGGARCVWDPWGVWTKDCEERALEGDQMGRFVNCEIL